MLCKKYPQSVIFFFPHAGSKLACTPSTEEWPHHGQEGSSPGLHCLPPSHSLGMLSALSPSLWFTTILFISNTWTFSKKRSMQFGLNTSFFKNLLSRYKSFRLLLKRKFNFLIINYLKKALLQWLKNILGICMTDSVQRLLTSIYHPSLCISSFCVNLELCLFIVIQKRMMNTRIVKVSKKVQTITTRMPL